MFLSIVLICLTYVGGRTYTYLYVKPEITFLNDEERDLYSFLERNLTSENDGIRTNSINKPVEVDMPRSSEVLSESVGLVMEYAVLADSRSLFEKQYLFLEQAFLFENGMVAWKVDETNRRITASNALIDDLRICRCLIDAYEKWGDKKYLKMSLKISDSIKNFGMMGTIPVDFYDVELNKAAQLISMRYLDLQAMEKLYLHDESWKSILETSYSLVNNSFFGKAKSFFKEQYDVERNIFSDTTTVNSVNQLITAENMMKAGIKPEATLRWLKDSFRWYGFIVSEYYPDNAEPASKHESTGVYAICCRLFLMNGDRETAERFYKRMNIFKITKPDSSFYGGYAFEATGECFSFDNLQALLTIRQMQEQNNK